MHSSYQYVFHFLIYHTSDLPAYFIDDGYASYWQLVRYSKMKIVWYFNILLRWSVSFVDHLCYFRLVLLCFHARLFVDALWSPAGKGLTSWLSFVMSKK